MQTLDIFDACGRGVEPDCADLFDLLAPVGRDRFFSEFWERKPFLVRSCAGDAMARILDVDILDTLVGSRTLWPSDLRVARDHVPLSRDILFPEGPADRQAIFDAFASGHTLIFDKIDQHVPALARMLYAWESDLKLPVRANAFLTPKGSSGFHRHYDTHDVIVVQIRGTKSWELCDNPMPIPHEEQQRMSSHYGAQARLIARIDMRPGDVAYLPRGYVHAASAMETDTLHLSVSVRNRALREVIIAALEQRLLATERFRRGVRPGEIDGTAIAAEVIAIAGEVDIAQAVAAADLRFRRHRVRCDDRLRALSSALTADDATVLESRPGVELHVEASAARTRISAHGESRDVPFDATEALRRMRSVRRLSIGELPELDAESRLALARSLLRIGAASPALK
nr:cupin domain-containing protein [uncultured Pseudoxanthomonas sp.]